mgnify:CR=1 FL=1
MSKKIGDLTFEEFKSNWVNVSKVDEVACMVLFQPTEERYYQARERLPQYVKDKEIEAEDE